MPDDTCAPNDVAAALAKVLPTAPDRLVRLFSLACLRRVRHLLNDTFCKALDVAELHVNGRASNAELGEGRDAGVGKKAEPRVGRLPCCQLRPGEPAAGGGKDSRLDRQDRAGCDPVA